MRRRTTREFLADQGLVSWGDWAAAGGFFVLMTWLMWTWLTAA